MGGIKEIEKERKNLSRSYTQIAVKFVHELRAHSCTVRCKSTMRVKLLRTEGRVFSYRDTPLPCETKERRRAKTTQKEIECFDSVAMVTPGLQLITVE